MKINKRLLLITALMLTYNIVAAQVKSLDEDFNKFSVSFSKSINYPNQLINNCITTVCILKINVNGKGEIAAMQLSDSADSLFKKEFNEQKHNLDTTALKRYITKFYPSKVNAIYIMPIYYSVLQMSCSSPVFPIKTIQDYYKFDNIEFNESAIFLKSANYQIKIQR